MNKHANHRDYICSRDMHLYEGWPCPRYGKFSVRNSTFDLIETLLLTWADRCGITRYSEIYLYPEEIADKYRRIALRLLYRKFEELHAKGIYPGYMQVISAVESGQPSEALYIMDEIKHEDNPAEAYL